MLPWSDCAKADQSGIILYYTIYIYTHMVIGFIVSVFNGDNASLLF